MSNKLHAGRAIAESLALHGVDRVFVVPGESYLAVLDGLYDTNIQSVVCRHEAAAAYMADAYGKFTGRPGVAMVTRGPGAAQAFTGIHTAWQDGVPMVLFVGLIPVADRERESFQEFDPKAWFGSQCKRVFVLDSAERASEVVAEAFFAAMEGRPGPVVVGLPEDIIREEFTRELQPVLPVAQGAVGQDELAALTAALASAKKPLLFVGGQNWDSEASRQLTHFAEQNRIPVLHDWRAADRIPFNSPAHAGYLGYGRDDATAALYAESDVLVAVGVVPGDVSTDGYTLRQDTSAITYQVNLDTSLRGRSGSMTHHILANPKVFARTVETLELPGAEQRQAWFDRCHSVQREYSRFPAELPRTAPGTAHMTALMEAIVKRLPEDAVYSFGAGNHCIWAQRYLPTNVFPSQLSARNGAMGYSVPAGIVASLQSPERVSVVIAGDGEFFMNEAELSTAVTYGAPILVVMMDNQEYGTIRLHQEQHYPGRVSGTQLKNPNCELLAQAFGAYGARITDDTQIEAAVEAAFKAILEEKRPALLQIVTDQALALPESVA